jgi:hypothetical protein
MMNIESLVDRKNQAPLTVLLKLKKGDPVDLRLEDGSWKVYAHNAYLGAIPDTYEINGSRYQHAIITKMERTVTMNFSLRCVTAQELQAHAEKQRVETEQYKKKYIQYQKEKESDKYRPGTSSGVSLYDKELDKELTWDYDPEP